MHKTISFENGTKKGKEFDGSEERLKHHLSFVGFYISQPKMVGVSLRALIVLLISAFTPVGLSIDQINNMTFIRV